MSNTLTIRVPEELLEWLRETDFRVYRRNKREVIPTIPAELIS